MNALISGGCGFIGSHLVRRLLADGHHVLVIDDFSEGSPENLPSHDCLRIYCRSVLDRTIDLFADIDTVFHLAALPRPQKSIIDPIPAHEVNVTGTLNVLLNCKALGIRRLVFASSGSVYGEQGVDPYLESAALHPMSPYGLQKIIGEQYCKLFTDIYGVQTNCLRIFNVYGDGMNPNGEYASLIPKFIRLIRHADPPTIYGTGKQRRDFVHVSDVVEAMISAAQSPAYGEVINIGSGINYSVNQIFSIICEKSGMNIEPLYGPAVLEPAATLASREKAYQLLGWEPSISIEEGIGRMVQ